MLHNAGAKLLVFVDEGVAGAHTTAIDVEGDVRKGESIDNLSVCDLSELA